MTLQRYSIIPARAVLDKNLTPLDIRVLGDLGIHTDKHGWCFKNQAKIAEELGVARQSVSRSCSRLYKGGYVEAKDINEGKGRKKGLRGINLYKVILDSKEGPESSTKEALSPEGDNGENGSTLSPEGDNRCHPSETTVVSPGFQLNIPLGTTPEERSPLTGHPASQSGQVHGERGEPGKEGKKGAVGLEGGTPLGENTSGERQNAEASTAEPLAFSEEASTRRTAKPKSKKESKAKTEKTRLPTDWELPDEWRDATKAEFGITDLDCAFVAQDFKKWWLGPEAKDPEKKDWRATWWRWVRKEAARGIRVPAKWSGRAAFSAEQPSQVSPQHRADERFDDKAPKIFAAGPVWVSGLLANSILRKAPGATKDDLMDVLLSGRFGMDTTEGYLDRYCVERLRAVLAIRRTGVSFDELAGGEPVTVGGVKFKDAFVQLSQRFMDRLTERYPRAFGYEAHHAACSAWYQTKSLATAENLAPGHSCSSKRLLKNTSPPKTSACSSKTAMRKSIERKTLRRSLRRRRGERLLRLRRLPKAKPTNNG